MNEETLRRGLQRIQGEEPAPEVIDRLRQRVSAASQPIGSTSPDAGPVTDSEQVTVLDLEHRPPSGRRRLSPWPVAAAAALLIGGLLSLRMMAGDDSETSVASTTEIRQIGNAWLQSIIDWDRAAFEALHADDVAVDDTLMGFSEDTDILTSARIAEIYDDGFDALQAALAADDDVIRSDGCQETDDGTILCAFTATMIGTPEYTFTVSAELSVEDRLITSIDFSTDTDPADLRSVIQDFMETDATDEDRACLALGFNTVGCGQHESDFLTRYLAFYEGAQESPDS